MSALIELKNIKKHFSGIKALDGVHLTVKSGEIVALIGENGAGKSTIVKILTGIYQPDSGEIFVKGRKTKIDTARTAWNAGITAIHQETVLFDELNVMENIFMGRVIKNSLGFLDKKKMFDVTKELLKEVHLTDIAPDTPLKSLSLAQRHLISIARSLSHNADVVILDEPTAALSLGETQDLYKIIRKLKEKGKGILFISHKFEELFELCNRYYVFRDGKYISDGNMNEVTEKELIKMLVGREIGQIFPKESIKLGNKVLEVKNYSNDIEFKDINFNLRKGEILGFYGLVGAGRSELFKSIMGLSELKATGEIFLNDKKIKFSDAKAAIDNGIAYLPEDRQHCGTIIEMSLKENITLPSLNRVTNKGLISEEKELLITREYGNELQIKADNWQMPVEELSGGNQQKVVIAKWLAVKPEIMILDEPTKGIDVASKAAVHKFISSLVLQGLSVVLISSELPEIMGLCDRIIVMYKGEIKSEINRGDFNAETIMSSAADVASDFGD
ncbi:sugar ABC transporter ATP-binding protein [bacterium]|nr:sugar ABC transporter ATP-binding protein [bacterium]